MNMLKKTIITMSLVFSFGASAELVSSDRYSVGDSAAVLDTKTGLEWLSLSQTRLANVSGSSLKEKMNKVALGNDGWRIATFDEVQSLYLNSFGTLSMSGIGVSNSDFLTFLSHFETSSTFDYHYGFGLYYNDDGGILTSGTSTWGEGGIVLHGQILSYSGSTSSLKGNNTIYNSVYLVSDGGVTYSSLNDENYSQIQREALAASASNVSAPLAFSALGLSLFALIGLQNRKSS